MFKKILRIGLWIAALFLLACALFLGYFLIVTRDVRLDTEKFRSAETALRFVDRAGSPIAQSGLYGLKVGYEQFPDDLVHAFVAVEDKNFFQHHGFDLKRMIAAAFYNLTSFSYKEGASTISQQLVKNTQLTPEKSLTRKFKELRLAAQLESLYSKEEILEFYLNTIYFGKGAYGVESAALTYFGKHTGELTLSECAVLAAVVKSPYAYSPAIHPENCLARRNLVLSCMADQNYISEECCLAAQQEELVLSDAQDQPSPFTPYLDAAVLEASERLGIEERDLAAGGFCLYTFCDSDLQRAAAELLAADGYYESGAPIPSACLILLDNADLGVTAFASRNIAHLKSYARQPGSAFKPIFTYAPALERGIISPATQISDQKTDFGGYAPSNFDDKYYGQVSAREALSLSLNVPAVHVLNAVGTDYASSFAEKLGICTRSNSLADALGATAENIPLTDLTGAYAAFANGGRYAPPKFIAGITDREGRWLYRADDTSEQVMRADTAYLMTDMLRDTVKTGTAKNFRSLSFDLAAKTGTVGTSGGNSDAYSLSYTSAHTLLCYQGGRLSNRVMGGTFPTLMARDFYKTLYRDRQPAPFAPCPEVVSCELDLLSLKNDQVLALADENAPAEYRISELFSVRYLPKTRAETFSSPFLARPDFCMKGHCPCIRFEAKPYYCYTVTRNGEFWQEISGKEGEIALQDEAAGLREATYEISVSYRAGNGQVFEGSRYRETFVLPLPLLPDPAEEDPAPPREDPAEEPGDKAPWWW